MNKTDPHTADYLGNAVYGALDGTVTTFAIIAGAIGAELSTQVIVILGLANLFADGFSMSVGSFLSEQSKRDYLQKLIDEKRAGISRGDKELKEEVEDIYQQKGFRGSDLKKAVHIVTTRRSTYLNELINAEGIAADHIRPATISLITFVSFVVVGSVPIVPLILLPDLSFPAILIFVSLVLFAVGAFRSRVTAISWWRGGMEIALSGVVASLIAFFIGEILTNALT